MGSSEANDCEDANADDPDDVLVRRIALGDGTAWPVLLKRHLSPVMGYAWYVLQDHAAAEDVAQETFVRLLGKVDSWHAGGPKLRTWLYRVAMNLCIDRRRARREVALDETIAPPDPVTDGRSLERRTELTAKVGSALARLPERQALALTLVHYQGFTQDEAARVLEVSVAALESLLARGRRTLRRELAPIAADLLEEG